MPSAQLISIIGPPASGKTTLAENLCQDLGGRIIREDFAGNPFLPAAYAGDADARLPGQIYFLMSRVAQLSAASWPQSGLSISDYGFCQDRIFAEASLSESDMQVYERIARPAAAVVRPSDVLICLHAPEEVLLDRIRGRGRNFERAITAHFLRRLDIAYQDAASQAACPVIRIDAADVDLRDEAMRQPLVERVRSHLAT